MISADEALRIIVDEAKARDIITTTIETAAGMVLAEDIRAGSPVPLFDNSGMDGYAIRAGDLNPIPALLKITGEIAAGMVASQPVGPGEAMAIMTGAQLPHGATAVVQQEWTEPAGDGRIKILRPVPEGHNFRRAGSDIAAGSLVLRTGTFLRAQETGLLASIGARFVRVFRKPRVVFFTTGSELVESGKNPGPGKIRDSNSPAISVMLRDLGCETTDLGIVPDDRDAIARAIRQAFQADLLITTGGVSVGTHDLVRGALEENGVRILFWKLNIKPGMPMLFGVRERLLVFGLPGNAVSSMVTFLQFVRPAIQKISGCVAPVPLFRLPAELDEKIVKQDGKRHYIRGVVERKGDRFHVRPAGSQVSNILTSMVRANCIIILPEEQTEFAAGSGVEVELLP